MYSPIRGAPPMRLTSILPLASAVLFAASLLMALQAPAGRPPARLIKDITAGPALSGFGIGPLMQFQGGWYFGLSGTPQIQSNQLWRTDLTPQGTRLIKQGLAPTGLSAEVNGKLVFPATTEATGTELWVIDGTVDGGSDGASAGASLLIDLWPGPASGFPLDSQGSASPALVTLGGKAYFLGAASPDTFGLYSTDATASGTTLVRAFTGAGVELRALSGKLYFQASDQAGSEPWVSDGTAQGTLRLSDSAPGAASSYPHSFTAFGNLVYFLTAGALWKTDGTPIGTALVSADPQIAKPDFLTVTGNLIYFAIPVFDELPPQWHGKLWRSDGTAAGTFSLPGEVRGQGESPPWVAVNGTLFYPALSDAAGIELWATDGSPAVPGSSKISTVVPLLLPPRTSVPWAAISISPLPNLCTAASYGGPMARQPAPFW